MQIKFNIQTTINGYLFSIVAICICVLGCSLVSDSATLWTIACQTLLSMKFFRQEYWSGLQFPIPRDLPYQGIKPASPALTARFFTTNATQEDPCCYTASKKINFLRIKEKQANSPNKHSPEPACFCHSTVISRNCHVFYPRSLLLLFDASLIT